MMLMLFFTACIFVCLAFDRDEWRKTLEKDVFYFRCLHIVLSIYCWNKIRKTSQLKEKIVFFTNQTEKYEFVWRISYEVEDELELNVFFDESCSKTNGLRFQSHWNEATSNYFSNRIYQDRMETDLQISCCQKRLFHRSRLRRSMETWKLFDSFQVNEQEKEICNEGKSLVDVNKIMSVANILMNNPLYFHVDNLLDTEYQHIHKRHECWNMFVHDHNLFEIVRIHRHLF